MRHRGSQRQPDGRLKIGIPSPTATGPDDLPDAPLETAQVVKVAPVRTVTRGFTAEQLEDETERVGKARLAGESVEDICERTYIPRWEVFKIIGAYKRRHGLSDYRWQKLTEECRHDDSE